MLTSEVDVFKEGGGTAAGHRPLESHMVPPHNLLCACNWAFSLELSHSTQGCASQSCLWQQHIRNNLSIYQNRMDTRGIPRYIPAWFIPMMENHSHLKWINEGWDFPSGPVVKTLDFKTQMQKKKKTQMQSREDSICGQGIHSLHALWHRRKN